MARHGDRYGRIIEWDDMTKVQVWMERARQPRMYQHVRRKVPLNNNNQVCKRNRDMDAGVAMERMEGRAPTQDSRRRYVAGWLDVHHRHGRCLNKGWVRTTACAWVEDT